MSTASKPHVSIIWRIMRHLNRRTAVQVIGRGPRGVVLLLTTIGRKSGLLRLKRQPIMMRARLAVEGQWRCEGADLEHFAANKALVAIRPSEKA